MTHVSPQPNAPSRAVPIPCKAEPISQIAHPSRWITAMTWLCGGLIGSVAISAQAAWARPVLNDTSHFLVAQQVVDGLPPPPPVIFGQESLTNGQTQEQRYLVVVNGDSDMVLSQVQQIQPSASIQDYNGQRFIQAGLFNDLATAQQQVATLAASGIGAQVVAVTAAGSAVGQSSASTASTAYDANSTAPGMLPPPEVFPATSVPSSPGEVEFGSSDPAFDAPEAAERGSAGGRSYYVVIPSGGRNLDAVTSHISRLTDGMGIDGMVQTGTSHGSHVRVGPFNSRSAATRWTRYFRDFGMDARINYGR